MDSIFASVVLEPFFPRNSSLWTTHVIFFPWFIFVSVLVDTLMGLLRLLWSFAERHGGNEDNGMWVT